VNNVLDIEASDESIVLIYNFNTRAFLCREDVGCFHCKICHFLLGSYRKHCACVTCILS